MIYIRDVILDFIIFSEVYWKTANFVFIDKLTKYWISIIKFINTCCLYLQASSVDWKHPSTLWPACRQLGGKTPHLKSLFYLFLDKDHKMDMTYEESMVPAMYIVFCVQKHVLHLKRNHYALMSHMSKALTQYFFKCI